jgi:transcription elongation GreA/GreB family factor
MNQKDALYAHCMTYVKERITRIREEIERAQSSANEETKSSAGDKYETSRAMAQLDVERNMVQLRESEKLQAVLQSLPAYRVSDVVIPGSLVTTSKGIFYIAISLGMIKQGQNQFFIISADSPIGKLLMGKKVGDTIEWNGLKHQIQHLE